MATVKVAARVKERMGAGRFATGPEVSVKASVGGPAERLRRSSPRLSAAQEEAPAFVPSNIRWAFSWADVVGHRKISKGRMGVRVMRVLEAGTLVSDWSGGSEGKGGRRMTESRGERARRTPDITIHDPDDVIGGVTGGGSGERTTGTPNTIYDLSSVLFHALEGGASYDTYIEDAEREGDQELAAFFRRVRDEDSARADDARLLLARRP